MTVDGSPDWVVVEPHADDAYLSLGATLTRRAEAGHSDVVVTIFGGTPAPKGTTRGDESAAWCRTIGVDHVSLGLVESGSGVAGDSSIEILSPDLIVDSVAAAADRDVEVVLPLGLQHPEHLAVAMLPIPCDLRYLDAPYGNKLKLATEIELLLVGREIVSWVRPRSSDYRHSRLFASQSTFFLYNKPDALMRTVEVVTR